MMERGKKVERGVMGEEEKYGRRERMGTGKKGRKRGERMGRVVRKVDKTNINVVR